MRPPSGVVFARPAIEWSLLLAAVGAVAAVRIALWVLPSPFILLVTRRVVSRRERPGRRIRTSPSQIALAVEAASRRVPHATCLTQALATQILLGSLGYGSRICLGVGRSEPGRFRAHVWVERNGRVLIGGSGSQTLTPLELEQAKSIASAADPGRPCRF